MEIKTILTIIATLLVFIGYIPYVINTIKGKTRPHIFSFFFGLLLQELFSFYKSLITEE